MSCWGNGMNVDMLVANDNIHDGPPWVVTVTRSCCCKCSTDLPERNVEASDVANVMVPYA